MKKTLSIILVFTMLLAAVPAGITPVYATTVTDEGDAAVTGGDDWQVADSPVMYATNDGTAAVSDVSTADGSLSMITSSIFGTKKFRFALLCDDVYKEMVDAFIATIKSNTGVTPSYGYSSYPQTYELIIGNYRSRSESATIDNEVKSARADNANDYIIRLVGTKIYIVGATDYALQNALDSFIELFVQDADGSIPASYNYYHKPDHVVYTLAGNPIADYTIRTERYPSQIVLLAAQAIQKTIIDRCGYILPIEAMNLEGTDAGDKEIRVGPMNGAVNVDRVYDTRFTSDDWQSYYTHFGTDGMLDADYGYYHVGFDGNNLEIEGGSAYAINIGATKMLADLAAKKNLTTAYETSGTYQSGYDYKQGSGYDAVDFSMTNGFGLVYAEEFDYEGDDEEKEKKVKSKWSISKESTDDNADSDEDKQYQYRPGVYGENWWVSADTAGNNYLFEITKKRSTAHGDADDHGFDAGRLVSATKWGFRYGLWETRIVMSTRNGACSAVWSNTSSPYSSAEPGHEIDVYENYGQDVFVPCLHAFYPGASSHNFLFQNRSLGLQTPCWLEPNAGEHFYDTFHHMSVEWTYDYIKVFFDGQLASEMMLTDDLVTSDNNYDEPITVADCYRNGQTIKLANGVGSTGYCSTLPVWADDYEARKAALPTGTNSDGTQYTMGYIPEYWMSRYGASVDDFFEVQLVDYTRVYQTSNDNISYAPAQNDIRFTPSFDSLSAEDEEEEESPVVVTPDPQSFETLAVGEELSLSNYKATVTDAEAHTGTNSVQMSLGNKTAALRPQVMVTDVDDQQVTVEQGKDYTVSFWLKVPEGSICERVHYWFTATNSDTAYSSGTTKDNEKIYEVNSHYIQQGVWQKIQFTIKNCAYSGNVRMGITGDYTGSYTFYVDDILIEPIVLDPTAPYSFENDALNQELDLNTTSSAQIIVTNEITAYSGDRVAKVGSSDGSGNKRPQMMVKNGADQQVYVYKGRNYDFSYYIYIPEGSADYPINYWLAATNFDNCFDGSTYKKDDYVVAEKTSLAQPKQGQWNKITLSIKDCAHTGKLRLGITSNGSVWQEFYIDDLKLVEIKGDPKESVQSFEDYEASSELSLSSSTAAIIVSDEDSRSGDKSAKVTAQSSDVNAAAQMILTDPNGNSIEVTQGKHYQVQFWVAAADETTDYDIQYWLAATSDDTAFSASNPRTGVIYDTATVTVKDKGEWHCVTMLVSNCAASGKLRLGICGTVDAQHTLYVDDVRVEERVSVDVDPDAMNFENYALDDNTLCINSTGTNKVITVTKEQYYTGGKAIKITSNDASGNTRPQFNAVDSYGNYMSVQQGENYSISFMLYIPEMHTYGTLSYWVAAIPEDKAGTAFYKATDDTEESFLKDDYVIYEVSAGALPEAGRWHKIDVPIIDCAYSGILRMGIVHGDHSVTGYLYVDDIKVEDPQSVTVKFVTNGADNTIADVDAIVGALLPYNSIKPVRDGYTFMGWYTSPDCSSDSYFNIYSTLVPSSYGDTMTLYAGWKDEDHAYGSLCDTVCDDCGLVREAPATHTYDSDCDAQCNVCQTARAPHHVYRADCGTVCTVCGGTRATDVQHTYANACDAECDLCGEQRTVDDHVYDDACDTDCNVCAAIRVVEHRYSGACDSACDICGDPREVEVAHAYTDIRDTDCDICDAERALTAIAVSKLPDDFWYEPDEALDTTGMELTLTYDDGDSGVITDGYTVSGYDSSAIGECVVTVAYGGMTATFSVNIGYAPQVIVDSATVAAGATFSVDVRLQNNPGIVSFKALIDYDADALELVGAAAADFGGVTFGPTTADVFTINWVDSIHANNATDGALATLTFRVKEAAVSTEQSVTVRYQANDVFDFDENNVYFDTVDGAVTVLDYVAGDASGDGKLNNKDLSILMRYLNGWDDPVDERTLDVNGDGSINNKDYVLLMRYLNGWDVVLK